MNGDVFRRDIVDGVGEDIDQVGKQKEQQKNCPLSLFFRSYSTDIYVRVK